MFAVIREEGEAAIRCINPECPAQLLRNLIHFCSRDAININGMSDATLQKFIDLRLVSSFKDIYHLHEHYSMF